MIFSDKEALLSLYNAISGKDYKDPDELEIVTLDNAIYMNKKNDLAFVIDSTLNLYEHQSTDSPNLPMRNLFYISRELEKVRKYTAVMHISQAVERAVNESIKEGILADFLLQNKAESVQMSIFEYDEEKELKLIRRDEREIGREEGIKEGIKESIKSFILYNLEKKIPEEKILEELQNIFGVVSEEGRKLISLYREGE